MTEIDYMEEPIVKASIITPTDYTGGSVMEFCQDRRGKYIDMTIFGGNKSCYTL